MKATSFFYSLIALTAINAFAISDSSATSLFKRSGDISSKLAQFFKQADSRVKNIEQDLSNLKSLGLNKRSAGAIAADCQFESRLNTSTSQSQFNSLLDDCNNSYSKLLNQDPSQGNAIALQAEIVSIKEKFSNYMNNYFLTHPANPINPTNPTNPGQTIAQACDVNNKLAGATTEEAFRAVENACNSAYDSLINQSPNRAVELQSEITRVKELIARTKDNYFLSHPPPTKPTDPTTPITPPNPGNSKAIAGFVNVDAKLASAKNPSDYDNLIQECNVAFSTLLAQDQSKYLALQVELEYLKKLINDIRNKPWTNKRSFSARVKKEINNVKRHFEHFLF